MTYIDPGLLTIDAWIALLSFILGFAVNKRFRFFFQMALLLFRMAKWYHDTHPEGQKKSKLYPYDEQMVALVQKNKEATSSLTNEALKHDKESEALG